MESPLPSSLPPASGSLSTAFWNRLSSEMAVPSTPPTVRLTINSTEYRLSGMACTTEFTPSRVAARPMPFIRASL